MNVVFYREYNFFFRFFPIYHNQVWLYIFYRKDWMDVLIKIILLYNFYVKFNIMFIISLN